MLRCMRSPAHLNDLVSGRLFTEPEIGAGGAAIHVASSGRGEGGARLSRLPLDPPLMVNLTDELVYWGNAKLL